VRILFVALVALVNAGQPVQSAMNARLREVFRSPPLAALASLMVSIAVLGLLAAVGFLGRGTLSSASRAPAWVWIGGAIGATSMMLNLTALPRIGALTMIVASVVGLLVAAALIDHFGWLGAPKKPIDVSRIAGIALLLGGLFLVQRR
jgi:transporter family-2 protein